MVTYFTCMVLYLKILVHIPYCMSHIYGIIYDTIYMVPYKPLRVKVINSLRTPKSKTNDEHCWYFINIKENEDT
jgi:hypothetical protein